MAPFYCVMRYKAKNIRKLYPAAGESGQSLFKAAVALKPGTCFGSGKSRALAESDAREKAEYFREVAA